MCNDILPTTNNNYKKKNRHAVLSNTRARIIFVRGQQRRNIRAVLSWRFRICIRQGRI